MKKYEISEDTLKSILAYLATKPYQEVFQGIAALSQLKEVTNESKKD